MANNLNNAGRLPKDKQRIFLNSLEIPGVQSFNSSFVEPHNPIIYLGLSQVSGFPMGIQAGNCSLSVLNITKDSFLPYTGQSGFNVYCFQESGQLTNNFSFTSGYLTSYSSRCSIGQIPQTDVNIVVLGNMGNINSGESTQTLSDFAAFKFSPLSYPIQVAGPNSLRFTIDNDFNTNRILSYELQISIPRNPIYSLSNRYPVDVFINWPLEVTLSLQCEVNDRKATELRDYPYNQTVRNITLVINDYSGHLPITTFNFPNMVLAGETHEASAQSNTTEMNLTYKGYIGPN